MDLSPLEDDQTVYVEELAGPDDYWLSLTDAARVCRVQDVSIRRAIKRQALPVRRQRAGQNKRTRLVRASDLALAGFPIIDTSAAISTEVGKVDVLSIPRQQQQIVQEHQELLLQMRELQEMFNDYQQNIQVEVYNVQERLHASLQTAREEYARRAAELETRLVQELEQIRHALGEAALRLDREQQDLRQQLTQSQAEALSRGEHTRTEIEILHQKQVQDQAEALARDTHIQTELHTLQTTHLDHQQDVQRRIDELAVAQQKLLSEHQQTVAATLQHTEQELQTRLQTLEQSVAERLRQVTQRIEIPLHDSQQAINTLNLQLTNLTNALAQTRSLTENVQRNTTVRTQELNAIIQRQQMQINQHAQLLPLLPYTRQSLATRQDLADLETRLQVHRYQRDQSLLPLLALLSPERLEILLRLTEPGEPPPTGRSEKTEP